jgi:4-azaleucine resistance transporter AzlC
LIDPNTTPRAAAALAIREGWPVLITPFLVGVPFGILARETGLDPLQTSGMSVIMFAGASQFVALELFRSGAGPLVVIATTLLINLRHLLMAASLRPSFGDRPLPTRLGLAYLLTDEAFAMGSSWYRRGGRGLAYYVTFAASMWVLWNLGTIVGVLAGPAVPDPRVVGLDFAITATFIAIVVLGIRGRRDVVIALVAAGAAGLLRGMGLAVVAVVVAGALAPLVARLVVRDDEPARNGPAAGSP